MRAIHLFVAACVIAGVVPFIPTGSFSKSPDLIFPGWPTHFQGRPLREIPLSEREKRFEKGFPGRMAKFSDGRRVIVMRWITDSTRKLHPASDCFRGTGYKVRPLPISRDSNDNLWGCIQCARSGETVKVSERVFDDSNKSWTDVSSWYWATLLGTTEGPWWAVTVVEKSSWQEHR